MIAGGGSLDAAQPSSALASAGVHHMRILHPTDGIVAFYDGRVEGYRFAEELNWVDDGALGARASPATPSSTATRPSSTTRTSRSSTRASSANARGRGRAALRRRAQPQAPRPHRGAPRPSPTARSSPPPHGRGARRRQGAIEAGTQAGPPGIDPLVLPTRTFEDRMRSTSAAAASSSSTSTSTATTPPCCGCRERGCCCRRHARGHRHLRLRARRPRPPPGRARRLAALDPERILPNHGDPDVIAAGGYPQGLIDATRDYLHVLQRCAAEPELRATPLPELVADAVAAGWLTYYAPYEEVHRENLAAVAPGAPSPG